MRDLVVAAAQAASIRGDVEANVSNHLRFVGAAAAKGAVLIVFPELSLTGYELDLADSHQLELDDPRLEPLRRAAGAHGLHVLAGGPWRSDRGKPYLAAFLLSAAPTLGYAKIHVHESEQQFFAHGREACVTLIDGLATGLAICADTSHPEHAAAAAAAGARLYVASVMKTEAEHAVHRQRLRRYAIRHAMAVLSANYAGSTGGAASAGGSGFWDERGRCIARAGPGEQALVIARRDEGGEWRGEVVSIG